MADHRHWQLDGSAPELYENTWYQRLQQNGQMICWIEPSLVQEKRYSTSPAEPGLSLVRQASAYSTDTSQAWT